MPILKFTVECPPLLIKSLSVNSAFALYKAKKMMKLNEITDIKPAVTEAVKEGINAEGPLPSDTLFYYANQGKWDAVIAMYHDQGLIPFKMLSFNEGVNVTIGLPIIRTSPDHGTAFDIAWSGTADPSSMIAAINVAIRLASNQNS